MCDVTTRRARPYSWVPVPLPSRASVIPSPTSLALLRTGSARNLLSLVRGSRSLVALLLGMTLSALAPALGQDTSRPPSADSLLARLKALEASVEVLQKQVAEQATNGVQTRSRIQVELSGRVVMNAFSNERPVNNVDDPQFVRRDSGSIQPAKGFGMAVRQTMLGLRANASDVAGGT